MFDLILQFPKPVIYFFRFTRKWVNRPTFYHIIRIVLAIALLESKRNFSNIGRLYLDSRHKNSISHCLNHSVFPGFLMHQHLSQKLLKETLHIPNSKRCAYIIIDSTCQKKKGKKMENRIIYKKGYSSDHFFVMGLLYFPDTGARIPLPRRLYRTKEYCKRHGKKYRSQVTLCEQIIRYAKVPDDIEIVVLFDSFFPSEGVINAIKRKEYHYVCSVKENRVDVSSQQQLGVIRQQLATEGQLTHRVEVRVSSKRSWRSPSSARKYETKVFLTYTEKYNLSKMGQAKVVFSQKADDNKSTFRYIATDMLHLTAKEIIETYLFRWQIELFFKEIKSYLRLGDYKCISFCAISRYVDLVIMTFMYLEYLRIKQLQEHPHKKIYLYARTFQMIQVLKQQVREANFVFLFRRMKTPRGIQQLQEDIIPKISVIA